MKFISMLPTKPRCFPLKSLMLVVVIASGCQSSKVERVVKLTDLEQMKPAAGRTLLFFGETGPMGMDEIEVKAMLDANGESIVQLQRLRWWARIDGTKFGTSVLPSDLQNGGTFRLYGPPPNPTDTNLYPSKYVLEIRSP